MADLESNSMAEQGAHSMADEQGARSMADKINGSLLTVSPFPSNIIKLTEDNFLVWKLQIMPILRGHKLNKYVLGNGPEFMKNLQDEVGEITEDTFARYSSDEQLWILQDQHLQG